MVERPQQFQRLYEFGAEPLTFSVDGKTLEARPGELLLTAILLHRGHVRDFEFTDAKRAGFCFMGACQDCWVTLSDGSRVRACDTLVENGMEVLTTYERNAALEGQEDVS